MEKNHRQLVAGISHDLRTPLATIQGYVETLLMKKKELGAAQQERYLNIIQDGTHQLQHLVEDLFELSKLEANETPLQTEPFSLADLAGDNAARCQIAAHEKQITLNINVSPDLPLVTGDIRYIDRVLQNLFDNAVKYCDINGKIIVELISHRQEVAFRIANTGVGIDPTDLTHLFDAYHTGKRTKKNIPQSKSSTGLGLAIVKKILQKHGSTITVESEANGMTVFTFSLKID